MRSFLSAILAATALTGCVSLAPDYDAPPAPVPEQVSYVEAVDPAASLLHWRSVFRDPELASLIETALEQNRDLRQAAANTERVRALYRIQRAERLPTVQAGGSWSRNRFGPGAIGGIAPVPTGPGDPDAGADPIIFNQYSANLASTEWELDLFGRVRSLSREALFDYFSLEATQRAAQVALISEVAAAYLNLMADTERLAIAEATLAAQQEALELTRMRAEGGVATGLDVGRVETTIEALRADMAVLTAQIRQDRNALRLLVGADALPSLGEGGLSAVAIAEDVPEAVPSEVLLLRPDVQSAEFDLRASNANIGAARAAFLPRISLTASGGTASNDLDALFTEGTGVWSFSPSISVPIFTGGALRAGLASSRATRDAATAAYEGSIQTAFREVADALAVRSTIEERVTATARQSEAAERVFSLETDRYEAGVSPYLAVLDAQRESYAARTALVSAELARAVSVVNLYRALGGGIEAPEA